MSIISEAREEIADDNETVAIVKVAHAFMEKGQMREAYAILDSFHVANMVSLSFDLMQTIKGLLTHIEQLEKQLTREIILKEESYKIEIRRDNEVRELQRIKFTRFSDDECWIYQEDDDNYLETLVCPVVIDAKILMGLLPTPPQREDEL